MRSAFRKRFGFGFVFFLTLGALYTGFWWGNTLSDVCLTSPDAGTRQAYNQENMDVDIEHHAAVAATRKCGVYTKILSWLLDFKISDVFLVLFTAILAWKTAGLDTATRGLQRLGIRQSRDTQTSIELTRTGVRAAAMSAIAAREAVSEAERNSNILEMNGRRQLRAYLLPSEVFMSNYPHNPRIKTTFRNSGQTPAHNVVVWSTMGVAAFPLLEEPQPPDGPSTKSCGLVAPGEKIHDIVLYQEAIRQAELREINEGRAAIFYYGMLNYVDAFDAKRWVKFCYYRGGDDRTYADGPMTIYREWNEAN